MFRVNGASGEPCRRQNQSNQEQFGRRKYWFLHKMMFLHRCCTAKRKTSWLGWVMRYLRFGKQNDYYRLLFFKPLFEKVSTDAERGNHESNRNPYQTFAGLRRVSLKLLINVPAWKNSKTNQQRMNFGNFRPMNGPKSWNKFPSWTIPSKTGKTLPTIRKNWRPRQNSTGKKRILNF